ncbi:hypothetical protein MIMGU_mgv1a019176mg, partial [Erythranthe guttata]
FLRVKFPKLLKNAVVRFFNHGWMLMMSSDEQTLFLYDPLNNQTIELPPSRAILTLLQSLFSTRQLPTTVYLLEFNLSRACPPILHDGKIYFLDVKGNVAVFDMNNVVWSLVIYSRCLKKRRLRKNMIIKEHFLIKPGGEEAIFAVFVVHDEIKVKVFKLMDEFRWKLVENLGDRVFYVSHTSAFGYTTDNKSKSMANKIFFPKIHDDNVVFYSLETHRYHSFEGDYSSHNCYNFEILNFATWVIPTTRNLQLSKELIWLELLLGLNRLITKAS